MDGILRRIAEALGLHKAGGRFGASMTCPKCGVVPVGEARLLLGMQDTIWVETHCPFCSEVIRVEVS